MTEPKTSPQPRTRSDAPGGDHDGPEWIGPYRVVRYIGGGGMGDVWLATDEHDNEVAIKLLAAARLGQKSAVERFVREGRTLSRLQHRNICRVYGIESAGDRQYLVMEYVKGVALSRLLRYIAAPSSDDTTRTSRISHEELSTIIDEVQQSTSTEEDWNSPRPVVTTEPTHVLPLQQTLAIAVKLCDAVQYAHEQGVMHRDLKPSNVVIRREGEPILLDFGVAKLADEVDLTMPGQVFGTMEYMAPEQARSPGEVDERADVYSLGAILYEMCVGQRVFVSSGNSIRDARRLMDHVPAKPRSVNRRIDRELQEIILKALSSDPALRYGSPRELAEDLCRYREGRPISARRPTVAYRLRTFIRGHRVALALMGTIVVLGGALGGFYGLDYQRRWGNWKRVLEEDFTDGGYDRERFRFETRDRTAAEVWPADSGGLAVAASQWCWLDGAAITGDVRVVARLSFSEQPDGFELVMNAAYDTTSLWFALPRGYACQVGGYNGTLDIVSINKSPAMAGLTHTAASEVGEEREVTVLFQRVGRELVLRVDGRTRIVVQDPTPLWGPPFERIGFRSYATGLRVKWLRVYRMSLPRDATPLVVGNALLGLGFHADAVASYLRIADDFPSSAVGEQAVVSAALAAAEMPGRAADQTIDSLLTVLEQRFPGGQGWSTVRERQMERWWQRREYERTLAVLPYHYRNYPETRIGVTLLSMTSVARTPTHVREAVFSWAARTHGVAALDCSGLPPSVMRYLPGSTVRNLNCSQMGLAYIDALASLRLHWLMCGGNRLTSLEPLRGQPIAFLMCQGNNLATLEGLESAPLRVLNASRNRLEDISAIAGAPLAELDLSGNRLTDLTALTDLPLVRLGISDNRIRNLTPLNGLDLTSLQCENNEITDLSPLRGMPIKQLSCGGNAGLDLRTAHGLPLVSLNCDSSGLTGLAGLSPFRLRRLSCSYNDIAELDPVEHMPLCTLQCTHNRIVSLAPLRGIAIKHLTVDHNRITTLAPLEGLELRHLSCQNNPLESFGPLLDDPPETFDFMGVEVDERLLRRAIETWSRRPEHQTHARQAHICLLLNTGRHTELHRLGRKYQGHTYLHVPKLVTWAEADSIARLCGGNLLTLSDESESRFAARLKGFGRNVWIGARRAHNRTSVVTGEPATYLEPFNRALQEGEWVLREQPQLWSRGAECAFVVEWKW